MRSPRPGCSLRRARYCQVEKLNSANLRVAAEFFAPHGVAVVLEPINARDIPGYFLNHQGQAVAIIEAVGVANTGLQMDFYHCQSSTAT